MIIINSPAEVFSAIIGKQKINNDLNFKPSPFCIVRRVEEAFALQNTFNGMTITLNREEFKFFKEGKLESKTAEELAENWFLVSEENNVFEFYKQLKNMASFLTRSKNYKAYTILTTTDCNARCYYCFEKNLCRITMNEKLADDVADYIIKTCSKSEEITLSWFGGEPLYNLNAIDIICDKLVENGIKFKSDTISNGILFNKETVKKAKKLWNMKKVQVTLDGTEQIYNKTKNYIYKNIESPFKTVIENIKHLTEAKIIVEARLNVTMENIKDLLILVDYLNEEFAYNKYFTVYATPLYEIRQLSNDGSARREEFEKLGNELYNKLQSYNLIRKSVSSKNYSLNNCKADTDSSVVISPNGKLYKCDEYKEEESMGDIYSGITKDGFIKEWRKERFEPSCKECPLMPVCNHLKKCQVNAVCGSFKKTFFLLEYGGYIENTVKNYYNSTNKT